MLIDPNKEKVEVSLSVLAALTEMAASYDRILSQQVEEERNKAKEAAE